MSLRPNLEGALAGNLPLAVVLAGSFKLPGIEGVFVGRTVALEYPGGLGVSGLDDGISADEILGGISTVTIRWIPLFSTNSLTAVRPPFFFLLNTFWRSMGFFIFIPSALRMNSPHFSPATLPGPNLNTDVIRRPPTNTS